MSGVIPNIDFGQVFDLRYEDAEVHCEGLGRLANFFGRNMVAHRHVGMYQVHLLRRGEIRLRLDELHFHTRAPLFFLTPPSVTHAFVISDDAEGDVLTVRQSVLLALFEEDPGGRLAHWVNQPFCLELDQGDQSNRLMSYFDMLRAEFRNGRLGRELSLLALARLTFVAMAGLSQTSGHVLPNRRLRQVDLQVYRDFNSLIETHFRDHWSLEQYAQALRLTPSRLNDICRRVADLSSKHIVHDRLLQEAKRLLLFSAVPVSQIAYELGFKDVSYFSRFFRRHLHVPPGEWRDLVQRKNL